MSASQRRRSNTFYSSSTILLAPRRLPMRSPPPPSVGGRVNYVSRNPPAAARTLRLIGFLVWRITSPPAWATSGATAPQRTPVPSIGTKTNVVAANRFGFFRRRLRRVLCAMRCERSCNVVSRLRGRLRNAPLLAATSALPLAVSIHRLCGCSCSNVFASASASWLWFGSGSGWFGLHKLQDSSVVAPKTPLKKSCTG